MNRAAAVTAELLLLAEQIRGGAEPGGTAELLTRARLVARAATARELDELSAAMGRLAGAVMGRMDEIERALRETGSRRSAISAYGSLRPFHSAQNLRTKA